MSALYELFQMLPVGWWSISHKSDHWEMKDRNEMNASGEEEPKELLFSHLW